MTRSEMEILIKGRAAIVVTVLATLTAINGWIGGSNSSKITNNTIAANNLWTHYGVKNVKAAIDNGLADALQANPTSANVKLSMHYRSEAQRMRDEPGDGMTALADKAKTLEAERNAAQKRSPWFTFAGIVLQIGIVLSTAAILAVAMPLFYASVGVGSAGALLFLFAMFGA